MNRTRTLGALGLLLAACLLAACGPSQGWSKKGTHPSAWAVDEENCAWEARHELRADGTYAPVARDDEEIQVRVRRCMHELGYTWGSEDD